MTYSLQFISENVILQHITGNYTAIELSNASQEMAGMLDTLNHPCYILVDLSKMKAIESNIVAVKSAVRPLLSHPRLALILSYGTSDSAVISFLGSFMASVFKIPVKILRKQEEAIEYLISQDASLKDKLQTAVQNLNQQSV